MEIYYGRYEELRRRDECDLAIAVYIGAAVSVVAIWIPPVLIPSALVWLGIAAIYLSAGKSRSGRGVP